jgi:hypothetical protein
MMSIRVRQALVVLVAFGVPALLGSSGDPGLLLVLDRERFELRSLDLRDDVVGPTLWVSLGSPRPATRSLPDRPGPCATRAGSREPTPMPIP